MRKLIIRIVIKALAFNFLLPMLPGFDFSGTFLHALGLAVFFSIILGLVENIVVFCSALWTISTLGLALLVLLPLWLTCFWVVPAVALELVSMVAPSHLVLHGWLPAILGGLVLMVINMITGGSKSVRESYHHDE